MKNKIIIFVLEFICIVAALSMNAQITIGPTTEKNSENNINESIRLLNDIKAKYGIYSTEYIDALINVECAYYYVGEYEKSVQYTLELLPIAEKLYGRNQYCPK